MNENYFTLKNSYILLLLLISSFSFGQTQLPFDVPGTYTFTVPAGVTSIKVEAWGSGAGGNNNISKGGGGGAFAANNSITVAPGTNYTVIVGKGAGSGTGDNGQDSSFGTLVIAKGANGVTGGLATSSVGAIRYKGGNGGSSIGTRGAGGGASAGSANDGADGGNSDNNNTGIGGVGINGGGSGGNGSNNGSGTSGSAPGGGGGERASNSGSSGGGGNGKVIITYTPAYLAQIISADTGLANWCAGETRIVTVTIKNAGTQPWTDGGGKDFNIGVKWNTNGSNWTDYNIRVDAQNLAAGATATYTFTLKASDSPSGNIYGSPLAAGTNNISFDVVYENVAWFGNNNNGVGPGNSVFKTPNITINALPSAPTAVVPSAATAICAGSSVNIRATSANNSIDWYTSSTGGTFVGNSASGADFSVSPTVNTTYYAEARNPSGCVSTSRTPTALINVNQSSVAGTVSTAQTICSGTQPASLTLSGQTGSVTKWQKATNISFTTGLVDINTTVTTLLGATIGNLTVNTYFRAVVQSGTCSVATTAPVLIQMSSGTIGSNTISYSNGSSGQLNGDVAENASLTLTAPGGTYFSQVNFASYGTPTGISPNFAINTGCHATTSQSVTETYLLGSAGSVSIPATNAVFGDPCVGTGKRLKVLASYAQPICSETSVTISGSTPLGSGPFTYQWESSTTSSTSGFGPATSTNSDINYTTEALTQTTWFRRVVSSCTVSSTSIAVMVKVNPKPMVTNAATASTCSETGPNITLTASAPSTFTWTIGTITGGISGASASSGAAINQVLTNPSNTMSGTVQYLVTPTSTTGLCTGAVLKITVTVNPKPSIPEYTAIQPNCTSATGTITITQPTGPGIKYSIDDTAYTNTTGVFSGVAAGTYNVTAKNASGCISLPNSVTLAISVKTWSGSAWSPNPAVAPTKDDNVILNGNYTVNAINGNINACSLTINSPAVLTITDDFFVTIQNDLTVNSGATLDVANQGSLVMINDSGQVTNNGTINVNKTTSPFKLFDYTYWSSPIVSTVIASTFPTWRTDRAYAFHPENFNDANNDGFDDNGDDWLYASSMDPGRGYIIMGPTNGIFPRTESVSFKGKVNNGVVTTPIKLTPGAAIDNNFNLVGNPYPSAISANELIKANIIGSGTVNKTIDGTLYFWTHNMNIGAGANLGPDAANFSSDDYAVYNLSGGTGTSGSLVNGIQQSNKPLGFIASGQGFFVQADAAGLLTFNNAMRVGTLNTQFYKIAQSKTKSNEKDRLWLNLENADGMFSQQLVGYFDNTTNDYDNGYDGLVSDAGNYVNFYSFIDTDIYKIQGREPFDERDQVLLGYSSAVSGTFNINIDSKEGVFNSGSTGVFLEDKLLNTIHNLKVSPYTFSTAEGTFDDRFVLRYTDRTLGNVDFGKINNQVSISKDKNNLKIKSEIETIKQITVFDLLGRQVFEKKAINSNEFHSSTIGLSKQVGIVKVTLENGQVLSRKVSF